jgi:hypothetical protein
MQLDSCTRIRNMPSATGTPAAAAVEVRTTLQQRLGAGRAIAHFAAPRLTNRPTLLAGVHAQSKKHLFDQHLGQVRQLVAHRPACSYTCCICCCYPQACSGEPQHEHLHSFVTDGRLALGASEATVQQAPTCHKLVGLLATVRDSPEGAADSVNK